jgi:hypothetical protein
MVERAKFGIYHRLSKKHLQRYLNEIAFRWNHRHAVKRQCGKVVMEPLPILDQMWSLFKHAIGTADQKDQQLWLQDLLYLCMIGQLANPL